MILAVKRTIKRKRAGFTILELVVTIGIMILMIGGALAVIFFNRSERQLNNSLSEVELLAKRARSVATLQQSPYALEITRHGVALMPLGETSFDPDERDLRIDELEMRAELAQDNMLNDPAQPAATTASITNRVRDAWQHDIDGMQIYVRRWGNTDWQLLERNDRHVWRFDPGGISEPIGIRFQLENGSWIAGYFHPLTAALSEIESKI